MGRPSAALTPVLTNADPQAAVDTAVTAINNAIAALVNAPVLADMTAYNTAVADAGALVEADYTAESWADLQPH